MTRAKKRSWFFRIFRFPTQTTTQHMNITITTQNRADFLFVESKGVVESADDLVEHANLVYAEFLKHNPKKILIYQMETEFPPGLSSYLNLVNHYIDNFVPEILSVKVAVVIQEKFKEIGEFWETVCTNRGFHYHAFTSLDQAEQWLLAE